MLLKSMLLSFLFMIDVGVNVNFHFNQITRRKAVCIYYLYISRMVIFEYISSMMWHMTIGLTLLQLVE